MSQRKRRPRQRLPSPQVDPRRSCLMARIRGKNSKPELAVRKAAHLLGYRFRLHRKGLPGTPDLVFPRFKKVIFVHGCFWHRHLNCTRTTTPKTRAQYWIRKFSDNVERDQRKERELKALGWDVLVVWECETRPPSVLHKALVGFLSK